MKACLLVHKGSINYIKNIADTLTEALQEVFSSETRMIICSSVDSADIGEAKTIFVIGENLTRFNRLKGHRYIFINFSVVSMIGNPFHSNLAGIRMIYRKKRMLKEKLDLFDALLDYYPAQTPHLVKSLDIPVFGFVPWVTPKCQRKRIPISNRKYDVCFVGGISNRRKKVLDSLKDAGCILSPSSGVVTEEVSSQSRCTLNIHMQRSNHLEIPRLIGAISESTIISEVSFGLNEIFPNGMIHVAPYKKLTDKVLMCLNDLKHLEEIEERARNWYCKIGSPKFKQIFISSVKEIQKIGSTN